MKGKGELGRVVSVISGVNVSVMVGVSVGVTGVFDGVRVRVTVFVRVGVRVTEAIRTGVWVNVTKVTVGDGLVGNTIATAWVGGG